MKYPVQSYILVRTWNLLFMYFTSVSQVDHEIYTKCKKTSNLSKCISSHNICTGIKSQQVKKPYAIQYQKLLIFLRIPLFHFIKLLLTILFHVCFQQINQQMEAAKIPKTLK